MALVVGNQRATPVLILVSATVMDLGTMKEALDLGSHQEALVVAVEAAVALETVSAMASIDLCSFTLSLPLGRSGDDDSGEKVTLRLYIIL